jgi:hypothetical protein
MSDDHERAVTANLLLERLELKRDIASIKADLIKRAEVITKLGGLLRSSPLAVDIGGQNISAEFAARAQKFEMAELDLTRVAALVDELRTKTEKLGAAERQIKEKGYSLD